VELPPAQQAFGGAVCLRIPCGNVIGSIIMTSSSSVAGHAIVKATRVIIIEFDLIKKLSMEGYPIDGLIHLI
jgi:hypothetical protein